MTNVNSALIRLGLAPREAERGLLLLGDDPEAFAAIQPLVVALMARDSRINLLAASARPETSVWLQNHFHGLRQIPLPFSNRISGQLYLRQLNVRVGVLLDAAQLTATAAFRHCLQQQAITVITLLGHASLALDSASNAVAASERVIAIDGEGGTECAESMTLAATAELLAAMMARDLKPLRQDKSPLTALSRGLVRLSQSAQGNAFLGWRFLRYSTIDELRPRLGVPQTILCLGNGPSSESPALAEMSWDVLFRVNHSWLAQRTLNRPQVVFTGGRPTMRAISATIFGLQTREAEVRLAAVRGLNPLAGRSEFFNVNDLTNNIKSFNWGHLRPTNGASMLAAAVALAPRRLVIAGIDLFQHPLGSYPWDTSSANAYSPGHSRETELEFILSLLSAYDGEVVILGDTLAKAWRDHCDLE